MALKYKVIKSKKQYQEYEGILEGLASITVKTKALEDEIELLSALIEKWDNEQGHSVTGSFEDPVALLKSLMEERNLRAKDLVEILGVSKGLVSDILNYKKGLSRENLRILGKHFRIDIALRYSHRADRWVAMCR